MVIHVVAASLAVIFVLTQSGRRAKRERRKGERRKARQTTRWEAAVERRTHERRG